MGRVYKGLDTTIQALVALKILLPALRPPADFDGSSGSNDYVARLKMEAELLGRVRHGHVCAFHGYQEQPFDDATDGAAEEGSGETLRLIVMDFIEGTTLRNAQFRTTATAAERTLLAAGLARGLVAIHLARVVHRDLKSANVVLRASGEPTIVDFGIAFDPTGAITRLTRTGAIVGTPDYMSPEQFRDSVDVDERSDIYSLGIVLFELYAGRPPFTANDIYWIADQHSKADPMCVAHAALIPDSMRPIIGKALSKKPEDRYATSLALLEDIEALVDRDSALNLKDVSRLQWQWSRAHPALAAVARFSREQALGARDAQSRINHLEKLWEMAQSALKRVAAFARRQVSLRDKAESAAVALESRYDDEVARRSRTESRLSSVLGRLGRVIRFGRSERQHAQGMAESLRDIEERAAHARGARMRPRRAEQSAVGPPLESVPQPVLPRPVPQPVLPRPVPQPVLPRPGERSASSVRPLSWLMELLHRRRMILYLSIGCSGLAGWAGSYSVRPRYMATASFAARTAGDAVSQRDSIEAGAFGATTVNELGLRKSAGLSAGAFISPWERVKAVMGWPEPVVPESSQEMALAEMREAVSVHVKGRVVLVQAVAYDARLAAGIANAVMTANLPAGVDEVVEAVQPETAFSPNHWRVCLIGVIVGLGGGLVLIGLLECRSETIRTPEGVKALGLTLVGVIPDVRRGPTGPLVLRNPQSAAAEAYRVARAHLLSSSLKPPGCVITVCSACSGEGRTTTVVNLAAALAVNGARVLIVDGDLRRPTIHQHFGIATTPGLTDLIIGKALPSECVQVSKHGWLHVLACGYIAPNPCELLGSRGMQQVVEGLSKHYDWMLIDTPPMLGIADASSVCRLTDAVLMVIGAEMAPSTMPIRAVEEVKRTGAGIVGAVLNRVNFERNSYYYSHYYSEYYRSYDGSESRGSRRSK